jgi:hypothetical protein
MSHPARPALALSLLLAAASPAAAQQPAALSTPAPAPAGLTDQLVLEGQNIVTVWVNGMPLRLEVSAEAFGPPVINPEVALRLGLIPTGARGWRFGPVVVTGSAAEASADFGAGPVPLAIAWSDRPASTIADGVIGVHQLPYARVTFALRPPGEGETVERFALKRAGGRSNARLGTEVAVGKKKLMMIFVPERRENLITAPTANFIATHQEGGFEPGSAGVAVMDFGVERPTRTMRIAVPILLGTLPVDRFAVRVEDYGEPKRVGEIAADDPRFDPNNILVSRRKGRGSPDLLTRIGGDQIAHCSSITYDFPAREIRLTCGPHPG